MLFQDTCQFSSTVQPREDPGRAIDGMQGSRQELDHRAYLARSDLVPKAVRFMLETGLLSQFQTLPTTYRFTAIDMKQPAA